MWYIFTRHEHHQTMRGAVAQVIVMCCVVCVCVCVCHTHSVCVRLGTGNNMVLCFVKELMMLTDFEGHMLMTRINMRSTLHNK